MSAQGSTLALRCYQIDAFTDQAFGGNAAAVVLLKPEALPLDDAVRQAIAAEKNLSETAFLECSDGSDFSTCTQFGLRWFTPATEVVLCGHATLAAAAAVYRQNPASELRFDTLSGELVVTRQEATGLLSMDLPLMEASAAAVPPGMGPGSTLVQAAVGNLAVEEVRYAPSLKYLLVVLRNDGESTRQAFLSLQPDNQALGAAHTEGQLVGVIVTLQGDGVHDFHSRFFAPWAGIAEDPVTGSAHAVLGPYWAVRLGKPQLRARQCSGRGGELQVEVKADAGRVVVAGHAVTVFEGHLLLPKAA
ncbi:hypothetical protein D9Q98_001086 [Chlorella vulgaris]|uniref:Uncharacterized protein n=1 Tax=Chlorella vulgaris TaxID=3077 RepID=A0A9D4TZH7_CHLVU|nr:hypothetical protein D9Q98_001086 [Chlorella vulgaris]